MIHFDKLPLNTRLLNAFSALNIDFVFQPIYSLKDNTLFAYEALMQPAEGTLEELFDHYTRKRDLHTLELATFYGATLAYSEKGYDVPVNVYTLEKAHKEIIKLIKGGEIL